MSYTIEEPGFDTRQGQDTFLATECRLRLQPIT